MKNTPHKFLSLLVMLTLLFSSFGAINVYADDATPVPEATEEAVIDEGSPEAPPEGQATEEAAADPTAEPGGTEPAPTEAAGEEIDEGTPEATEEAAETTENPTDEATEEANGEPTEEADPTEEPTEEPTTEPTPMLPDEDLDTLPEILGNVPDGTDVVVLGEDGNVAPMASEEASDTLVEGDPVWCPSTQGAPTPGLNGCTPSFTSFSALIAELSSGTYTGAGTIWVANTYAPASDTDQILFNGNATYDANTNPNPLDDLTDLTIQGGWVGTSGDATISGTSTIGVSMAIINWVSNLSFNDLVFTNTTDNVGFGLSANTTGTVTIDNVSASGSTGSNSGAVVHANAGVTVQNSNFSNNGGDGLLAYSSAGNVNITNTNAAGNATTGMLADTCNWNSATQSCLGTGSVSVQGGSIGGPSNGNGTYGLRIASGGSTTVTGVNASNNNLTGLMIENLASGTAGNVTVFGGSFNNNAGGAGIRIYQYANGNVTLNTVETVNNRYGAIIDNTVGTGGVSIDSSIFAGSTYTGLHIESKGDIQLDQVEAGSGTYTGNGSNGAYLISDGNITIDGGSYNGNVNSNFPADPGIFAKAGGNITLLTVTANNNTFGPGAVLKTTGTGDILVSAGSIFNQNGSFGVQATSSGGSITISDTTANLNAVKGAYLDANGAGNILIQGGTFNENGSYGIYGSADEGDITVMASMFDGAGVTGTGAKFIAENGGDIILLNPTFQNNEIGAYLVGEANITLNNVIADTNAAYGVKLFSTFTQKGCYCPGDENTSIIASIIDGTFQNSEVGIYAKPGDEGTVTFTGTQTYSGNTEDYVLNTDAIPQCDDCNCVKEEKESKPYNSIEVPFSGSGNVPQQCDIYAGTVLQMENGVVVKVRCPFEGFSNLQGVNFSDLPGVLDEDMFELGILLGLLGEDGSFILNSDGTITLNFTIPAEARGRAHQLLFWDTEMNDGDGGWVEMPPFEHGTSFFLHPEDPDDPRMIVSGVVNNGNTLSITVNFAGYFVVVGQ
jgi:hypothetical protein